jgi:glycosyltransferase involved in cell wall biosynthesis
MPPIPNVKLILSVPSMTIDSHLRQDQGSASRDVILIHRQFPGQFEALAEALLEQGEGIRVWGVGHEESLSKINATQRARFSGIEAYESERVSGLGSTETRLLESLGHGRAVARRLQALKSRGISPFLVVGHLGWGECTHVKSVFPESRLLGYCEFFHHPEGVDAGFDPEFSSRDLETRWGIRELNAVELLGLEAMDMGLSPTRWQRDLFPKAHRARIRVIHEGVDTTYFSPRKEASFSLPTGEVLTRRHPILTFATSSLEPYRGVHSFVRALPDILARHPDLRVVMAGEAESPRYGRSGAHEQQNLLDVLLEENGLPQARIHRVGRLPKDQYRNLLRVSRAHVYLTVPFVLSWSLLEAMATGIPIVASATPPVLEVLHDEDNALLVDFFSPQDIAQAVDRILTAPSSFESIGMRARQTVISRYDRVNARRAYVRLIDELLAIRGEFRERSLFP